MANSDTVVNVTDLNTIFHTHAGQIHAVNGVSFNVKHGELLGVVGESGSGKSVTMMSLLQLLPSPPAEIVSGRVEFEGQDLLQLDEKAMRSVRGARVGFIFQDPMTSLNPVFSIGFQLMEPLRKHMGMSRRAAKARAIELLDIVGIPSARDRMNDYPHQFSGGMRQRVMIAMALTCDPKLLIADEPTTALDVTVQAQILELVRDLRKQLGMAIIWITHDLGVVAGIADRVAVMYGGLIVELASVDSLYATPRHPYTRALLQTLPEWNSESGERSERLFSIKGQPPNQTRRPDSCPFEPRCDFAIDKCREQNPSLVSIASEHTVACWWVSTNEDANNER